MNKGIRFADEFRQDAMAQVTVELSEGDRRTTMTMTDAGVPAGTLGEGGWMQAFDELGDVLRTA